MTFAVARQAAGAERGPDSATVVLRPAPTVLPPAAAASELLAVSAQFFGAQADLDAPTDLGRCESKVDLIARTRALCAERGKPIVLAFGAAAGSQYLGAALEHGRFDATAGSLFGMALVGWLGAGRAASEPVADSAASSMAISQRSLAAWRRALNAVGGVARCAPPAVAPYGSYLRLPRGAGRSGAPSEGGLVPVLDAIGQALGRGRRTVPRLLGVTGSNRQYPDLAVFAGMAAQPGPIVLDGAVTSSDRASGTRRDLLQRRLLGALRAARWCPNCLDAEFGRFDSTLCEFFVESLVVNDTRQLDVEFADVLDQVPDSQPTELPDWPFHPGGSTLALTRDATGDTIFALRSSAQALSGIEPADFLVQVSANLRCG